jgi:hypothetical protein
VAVAAAAAAASASAEGQFMRQAEHIFEQVFILKKCYSN